ncbi:uncharacterized protein LOC143276144 [Babylonia areolata]|uniref:uncharacterized protein LOC143276144 n=1 Tax=Babylonia areolata TaxID=304850 RepID=UPI003FD612C9
MVLNILFVTLIVCSSLPGGQFEVMTHTAEQQNYSTIDPMEMMRRAKVVLHPPKNLTFFLVTPTEAVVGWLPPNIYKKHDVNTSLVDPVFNATMVWLNHTYPVSLAGQQPSTSDQTDTVSLDTPNGSNGVRTPPTKPSSPTKEMCKSLEFFANYTVGVNVSEEALKDYIPHLIRLKDVFVPENVTVDVVHKDVKLVPFSQGCVQEYRVFYYDNETEDSDMSMEVVNATERPEVHLKNLKPGTNYSIYVAAVFFSNTTLESETAHFTTGPASSPTRPIQCICDWAGTNMKDRQCKSNITQPCECRDGHRGRFCELCAPGYYRSAPYFPCHRCPCITHATRDNSCGFQEGFLKCSQCEVGYEGNICHMCAYGYYRHHKFCVPCNCNNNHNRSNPRMCDIITGACNCMHNASGMDCELCRTGYTGDALHLKNCAPEDAVQDVFEVLSEGEVAGICVGLVLLISFIGGCIMYRRMSNNPPKRPFWTVELKDDHEGVNFNTVPNDDFQITDPRTTMGDMDFYEQQGGKEQSRGGGSSGQKYARLQENV